MQVAEFSAILWIRFSQGSRWIMKRGLAFLIAGSVLVTAFAGALDVLIRYNLNWIDFIKYSFALTKEEQDYLNDTDLVCGVKYNDLPLSFVNEEDENDGILIDFLSQLSIEVENAISVKLERTEALARGLQQKQFQAVIAERGDLPADDYYFTEPLYIMHGKMLVKDESSFQNIKDIKDVRIAVERTEADSADRIKELYGHKNIQIVYAEDFDQALDMLKTDRVEVVAGDETKISYHLNQKRTDQYYRFLKYSFSRKEVCIAIEKSQKQLLSAFNKGILSMKKKNLIAKTQSKWFGVLEPEMVDMQEVDFIYKVALSFLISLVAFTVWNLSTAKKVTDKTRELLHSKEQLRLIIDTLDRGLIIAEEDGTINEVNRELCRITGAAKEQLQKTSVSENSALQRFFDRDDEKVFRLDQHYYIKKTIDLTDEQKRLYILEDCTRRYINEIRNIQEEKMIAVGQLSAGLAHEIRNPLGLIRSYMYLIRNFCTGEDGTHAVAVINDSINRINGLIESLLKFSKLSSDECQEVDLDELISNILRLEKEQMTKRNITCDYCLESGRSVPVYLNEDLMKMIIINLLNNSIEALEKVERQGRIEIRAAAEEDAVHILFRDNGCGVSSEKLLKIFNPFYTDKEQGTGLGLYIISSQLEQIGGNIRAESAEGEGTTFYIEIPTRRTEDE